MLNREGRKARLESYLVAALARTRTRTLPMARPGRYFNFTPSEKTVFRALACLPLEHPDREAWARTARNWAEINTICRKFYSDLIGAAEFVHRNLEARPTLATRRDPCAKAEFKKLKGFKTVYNAVKTLPGLSTLAPEPGPITEAVQETMRGRWRERNLSESEPAIVREFSEDPETVFGADPSDPAAVLEVRDALRVLPPVPREVASLLIDGLTRDEISARLKVSLRQVRNAIEVIKQKIIF